MIFMTNTAIGTLFAALTGRSQAKKQGPLNSEVVQADHEPKETLMADPVLLAVITAAIAAYNEQETSSPVGMIQRKAALTDNSWVLAGRLGLMNHNVTKYREGASR